MEEKPYQNRELDEKFRDIKDTLDRIEKQTTKTNGSVAKLKLWQSYTIGFCACLSIMFLAVFIPLAVAFVEAHK